MHESLCNKHAGSSHHRLLRNLGYLTFGGKVGGGVSENLTLDGSLNFQLQDYDQSGIAVKTNSTEMLVGGNYFWPIDQAKNGLFLRGEVGLVAIHRGTRSGE